MEDYRQRTTNSGDGPRPFGAVWGSLTLLVLIFFLNFTSRIILAPLLPEIEKELNITHAAAGSLFFFISMGYFIMLTLSGFVSARLTHRHTILVSTAAVALALFLASISEGLFLIRLALLGVGLGTGLYLSSGIAAITSMVIKPHWGRALGLHEMAPNLAFLMAPIVIEALAPWMAWRGVLRVLAVAALAGGTAYAVFGRGGRFHGTAPTWAPLGALLKKPALWVTTLLFSMGIAGTLGIYTMLVLYLVSAKGFTMDQANGLLAASRAPTLVTALAGGWLADRVGVKRTMVLALSVTGLATVTMGLSSGWVLTAAVFLQPVLAVGFFPAGFATLSRIATEESRNLAVSLAVPVAFIVGGGAIPTLIGWFGEHDHFGLGMSAAGTYITLGALVALLLKIPEEDENPTA